MLGKMPANVWFVENPKQNDGRVTVYRHEQKSTRTTPFQHPCAPFNDEIRKPGYLPKVWYKCPTTWYSVKLFHGEISY